MFQCVDCDTIVEKPYKVNADSFYGVGDEFNYNSNEYINVCPRCGSLLVYISDRVPFECEEEEEDNND